MGNFLASEIAQVEREIQTLQTNHKNRISKKYPDAKEILRKYKEKHEITDKLLSPLLNNNINTNYNTPQKIQNNQFYNKKTIEKNNNNNQDSYQYEKCFEMYTHNKNWPENCKICGGGFPHKSRLKRHMKIHTDMINKPKKLKKENQSIKLKSPLGNNNDYNDNNTSNEEFKIKTSINKNINNNNNEIYKCSSCDKKFTRKNIKVQHETTVHNGVNSYECELENCHKKFRIKVLLNKHIKTSHKKITFYCEECDKNYYDQRGLERHKQSQLHKTTIPKFKETKFKNISNCSNGEEKTEIIEQVIEEGDVLML